MAEVKTEMTVVTVEAEVERIRAMRFDAEAAHSAEDDLWESVLRVIAAGETDQPAELAAAALKTLTIDFARWCA